VSYFQHTVSEFVCSLSNLHFESIESSTLICRHHHHQQQPIYIQSCHGMSETNENNKTNKNPRHHEKGKPKKTNNKRSIVSQSTYILFARCAFSFSFFECSLFEKENQSLSLMFCVSRCRSKLFCSCDLFSTQPINELFSLLKHFWSLASKRNGV
jgi:hypothetical protein